MATVGEARPQRNEAGRAVAKNAFTIADPAGIWFVDRGVANVFVTRNGITGPEGALRHVVGLREGQAIFGFDTSNTGCSLLVRLNPESEITFLQRSRLDRHPALANGRWMALLEEWIENLSQAAINPAPPRKHLILASGKTLTTHDTAKAILPEEPVAWIRCTAGDAMVASDPVFILPLNVCYPISRFSWIVAKPESQIEALDIRASIRRGLAGGAFQIFGEHVMSCLKRAIDKDDEKSKERLHSKRRIESDSIAASLRKLAAPVTRKKILDDIAAGMSGSDGPLLHAARAIGEILGVEFQPYPSSLASADMKEKVASMARVSGVRVRPVAFRGVWWQEEGGPLLAFERGSGIPVACLPRGRGYVAFHPSDRRVVALNSKVAETLDVFGYSFYRPFPNKPMSVADLLKFSIAGSWREVITMLLAGSAGGILALMTPLITSQIFDTLIPSAQRSQLFVAGVLLVASGFSSALFNLCRSFQSLRLEGRMSTQLEAAIWDRLLSLPVPFFKQYTTGELASRVAGVSEIRGILTGSVVSSIMSGIFSLFSGALLFVYSWQLALLGFGLTAISLLIAILTGSWQLRRQREMINRRGKLSGLVFELINGMAKFRVAGAESRAYLRWLASYSQQKESAIKARFSTIAINVFNSVYSVLSLIAIYALNSYVSQEPASGAASAQAAGLAGPAMSTGHFLAFMAAFNQFLGSILALNGTVFSILRIVPLYERSGPILQTLPEDDTEREKPGELTGGIEVNKVSFRYAPDTPLVFREVSFSVKAGQYIAIVGPSGCGKSTLFRLLLGFEKPESGAIYYDGKDLASLDLRAVRRQTGVVLQSGKLIGGTIFSNIVGNNVGSTMEDAWEAARLCGFDEDIKAMPMGMHTLVQTGGTGGISGGQRQRMMIARAIVHKPRILLLDEATSALDNRTQAIVVNNLKNLKTTRIVIAHRLSTVAETDQIIVMDKGGIVETGSYDELLALGGHFAALAKRQTL